MFQVSEGEARVASLQREVERLTALLSKAQDGESVQKERVLTLSQSLQEATAAHSATQGRLAALQKTLGQVETERRQLQVRSTSYYDNANYNNYYYNNTNKHYNYTDNNYDI